MPEADWTVWAVIGLSALVTFSFRFGGLSLAQRLPQKGPVKKGLDALPGCILISLVAPGVLHTGPWGLVGALAAAGLTIATKNVFIAMAAAMAIVAGARYLGW